MSYQSKDIENLKDDTLSHQMSQDGEIHDNENDPNRSIMKSKTINTVKDQNISIEEMKKRIKQLTKIQKYENSKIETTRLRIKKIMNVRKKIESRENLRQSVRDNMEREMENRREKIQIARERDKISKLTLKMAMEQKQKDVLYQNKEQDEIIKQQKQNQEKQIQEQNREKRERIRKMTEVANQKIKAYEAFSKMKNEKQKEEEIENNTKIIDKKDSELKELLALEEELMVKINKSRQAKKGIERHYDEYISKENQQLNISKSKFNNRYLNDSKIDNEEISKNSPIKSEDNINIYEDNDQ